MTQCMENAQRSAGKSLCPKDEKIHLEIETLNIPIDKMPSKYRIAHVRLLIPTSRVSKHLTNTPVLCAYTPSDNTFNKLKLALIKARA